jgi:uncharacterized protein with FMN-binding domain
MRTLSKRTRATIISTGAIAATLTSTVACIAAPVVSAAESAATGSSGTFVGATSKSNKYTPTTVTIKVSKGKVTKVTVKVSPTDPASVVINKDAIPKLTQEALAAQSAKKVAVVSGASLTSAAFKQSLQSALTKAGIKG